jgi:eukaryotic-like serine/threonine-protein kinase
MNPAKWKTIKEIFSTVVELPRPERDRFLSASESEIRDAVEKLLAAHEHAEGFINKPVLIEFEEKLVGRPIDDYLILKKIGEGGMGTVFLAEQQTENFRKKVALKLIKRGMDTSAVLKRFLMERQILAQLDHPNIARLVDGGSTADGLPYFVMEYAEGENIREFCRDHQFDTNERLALFLKVSQAISYAHQQLIVHRDIKPSNIMVTAAGEPKLLDFGVAKLLAPDWSAAETDATVTNFRLMTPEYASPEQLRGKITTTATDVYSLGIVLYELLTGTRPYDFKGKNPLQISEEILTKEPVKPSAAIWDCGFRIADSKTRSATAPNNEQRTTNHEPIRSPKSAIPNPKSLRGDLDNIILKAIRKEAGERYRSVEEFGDDINRYLTGLPVRATADSTAYRFRKFIGRNKIGTAIAAVILLLSFLSVWQAIRATRAQAHADERFKQVRKLANAVLFDYQDGIQRLPGATAVREKMVNDGAEYLDNLAAENSSDPELRTELAKAYDRLGDVKGNFFTPSLGNSAAAKEFYAKALAIREKLCANFPNDWTYAEQLAVSYDKLADLEFGHGNQTEAVEYYRKAVSARENILRNGVRNTDLSYRLMKGYRNLAVRGRTPDNTDESLALCQKAIAMIENLLAEAPANVEYQESRADFIEGLAAILETNRTRRSEALEVYRKVIEIRRAQSAEHPNNSVIRQKFGMSYSYLGDTFYELKNLPESIENYRKSLEILDPLALQDPLNEQLKQDQAAVRGSLAFALADTGGTTESLAAFDVVLRALENKYATDQNDSTTHFRIAMAKEGIARTYENFAKAPGAGRSEQIAALEKARRQYEQSLEIYKIYQNKTDVFPAANVDVDEAVAAVTKGLENCRNQLKNLTGKD